MENTNEFDVEAALKRLDEINGALARDNVSLKDSMALYKEGVELAAKCNEHLKGVEQEIKIINDGKDKQ